MEMFLEYRWLLVVPVVLFLMWVARKGRQPVQQPEPVAPVQPQQQPKDVVRDPSRRVDKFVLVILIAAIVFLGFNFLMDQSGSRIPDIASVQRVLSADSTGSLFANWNTLTGNPDGSRPIGSGTALVMIVVALSAFIFGRGINRRDP